MYFTISGYNNSTDKYPLLLIVVNGFRSQLCELCTYSTLFLLNCILSSAHIANVLAPLVAPFTHSDRMTQNYIHYSLFNLIKYFMSVRVCVRETETILESVCT